MEDYMSRRRVPGTEIELEFDMKKEFAIMYSQNSIRILPLHRYFLEIARARIEREIIPSDLIAKIEREGILQKD